MPEYTNSTFPLDGVNQQITHDPPQLCLTQVPLLNLVIVLAQVPADVELKTVQSKSQMAFHLLHLMSYVRYNKILSGLTSALTH